MNEPKLSEAVAGLLAWIFPRHREPTFLDYLSLTFSEAIAALPRFEKLCLAEAENGNVEKGEIGGIIKRWWLADEDGFRSVNWGEMPRFAEDFNDAEGTDRMFYRFPLVKFLREGAMITFGEKFGPNLACRKVGRMQQAAGNISIVDVRLVWNAKSIRSGSPVSPMSPALDIDSRRTTS